MRREKCSLCGREVEYKWVDSADYDNPNAHELVAWRCLTPDCPNHYPEQQDFDWAVAI